MFSFCGEEVHEVSGGRTTFRRARSSDTDEGLYAWVLHADIFRPLFCFGGLLCLGCWKVGAIEGSCLLTLSLCSLDDSKGHDIDERAGIAFRMGEASESNCDIEFITIAFNSSKLSWPCAAGDVTLSGSGLFNLQTAPKESLRSVAAQDSGLDPESACTPVSIPSVVGERTLSAPSAGRRPVASCGDPDCRRVCATNSLSLELNAATSCRRRSRCARKDSSLLKSGLASAMTPLCVGDTPLSAEASGPLTGPAGKWSRSSKLKVSSNFPKTAKMKHYVAHRILIVADYLDRTPFLLSPLFREAEED
jgi:hypothetical protein